LEVGLTTWCSYQAFISHIENYWENPDLARWLLRLAGFARVIMFDKRGTGLSDPVPQVPSLELRMDNVRAVMDATDSKSATLLGVSEGGALAALFAATYSQRCQRLVITVRLLASRLQPRFSNRCGISERNPHGSCRLNWLFRWTANRR
jgi:pimeloyl-ACP methyl ester carboxylesterase